jgi:hypothetical protein
MQDRTPSQRHLCSELVSVSRLRGRRSVQALAGNLEEIGESSALILTEAAVPTGTKVRVTGESNELKGFVKSCTFDRLLGFFIEIRLDAESRWSEKWFVPAHLFALRPSMRRFTSRWSEKWFVPEHLMALCPSMKYFTYSAPKVPEKVFPVKFAHV